jgi:hypothetical protein
MYEQWINCVVLILQMIVLHLVLAAEQKFEFSVAGVVAYVFEKACEISHFQTRMMGSGPSPAGPIGVWARMNLGDQWKERSDDTFNLPNVSGKCCVVDLRCCDLWWLSGMHAP